MAHILIVEDEEAINRLIKQNFGKGLETVYSLWNGFDIKKLH